jgi:simple sugar transport system substrate-binding protein
MQVWHQRTGRIAAIAGAGLVAATVLGSALALAQDQPEKKKLLIYDVQVAGGNNGFHAYLIRGADQAGKDLGIDVVSIFPDQPDLAQQLQKIEEALVAQPDGIVINCGLGPDDAYASVLATAQERGIAMGCSAAPPPGSGAAKTPGDPWLFRVGSQEDVAGQVTGQRLLELGATGRVLINQQQPQDVTCAARAQGEKDVLEAAGVTGDIQTGNMDPGQDSAFIVQYLRANPDTTAVTSVCNIPDGMLDAKAQSGRTDLLLSGYDVVSQALQAIQDGQQAFTIDQQQYWRGYMPVLLMAHYLWYGLEEANYFLTGPSVIDKDNVGQVSELVTAGFR